MNPLLIRRNKKQRKLKTPYPVIEEMKTEFQKNYQAIVHDIFSKGLTKILKEKYNVTVTSE